jgi:hypothetical protein
MMFVGREIPKDYLTFRDALKNDNEYSKILWIPTDSRWSYYSYIHPGVSLVSMIEDQWQFVAATQSNQETASRISDIINTNYFHEFIDQSSIKYIVVPIQDIANDDDFFSYYGGKENPNIRQWYIELLDKAPYLERLNINTKDLIVYENKNYKPYISTLNNPVGIESFNSLNIKYNYFKNDAQSEFTFYDLNKSQLSSRKLYLPFESIAPSNIANGKIDSNVFDNNYITDIYTNTNKKNVLIKNSNGNLEVTKFLKNNISINGSSIIQDSAPDILFTSKANNASYFVEIGDRLINIEKGDNGNDLGVITKPFDIMALSENNSIQNASFENGEWSKSVGDCNAYDSKPILDMETSNNASEGSTSIQLDATSHIACTGQKDILVNGGQNYLFSFDYQSPNAKNAGFYIEFNDASNTSISEKLPVSNTDWNNFQKKIEIPIGATKMNLLIYSYSKDNKTKVTTRYDNFKLLALEHVTTIDPKYEPHFEKITIPANSEYKIEYSDSNNKFDNLIKNPSLEDGLWSAQVGDCNNYDNNGLLSMSQSAEQKTNGNYSLQLGATRHNACTGPGSMPVTEDRTYLLSFDYQSPNGKEAGYYIGFNDPNNTTINERLPIKDDKWHTFTKQIKVPAGASTVSLIVYAYSDNGEKEIINRYDNFSFIELPDLEDRYFLVTEPKEELNNPASINFDIINPSKKLVHIKGATTPFYLAMSESYHPQWLAEMNDNKVRGFLNKWIPWINPDRVSDDKHFQLDGFLNGWYVEPNILCANNNSACTKNPDGSYDMEMVLEFFPQRWFYFGLVISGGTFFACIVYLGYAWRKRKKNKHQTPLEKNTDTEKRNQAENYRDESTQEGIADSKISSDYPEIRSPIAGEEAVEEKPRLIEDIKRIKK